MRDAILAYFAGEKHAALTLTIAGAIVLVVSIVAWSPRWGLRSLSATVGVFAVLMLAIGIGLYMRTGPQVDGLLTRFGSDAAAFYAQETARMLEVQRRFVIVETVELALVVGGSVAAFAFKARPAVMGTALGLLLCAAFLLAFDLVAERRGATYLSALQARD